MITSILTLFPELYTPFVATSLIGRAQKKGILTFDVQSYFSFCEPKERIDSPTFGHTAGMLLKPEIVERAIVAQTKVHGPAYTIFFSPQGTKLNQHKLQTLAQKINTIKHLMLVTARYEGMDARVEQVYADEIISIGDYVLMGGDLPAMVLLEGILRLIPGVIGKEESVTYESFSGAFVEYPEYTAPVEWHNLVVPEVLRSGNHKAIAEWRQDQSAQRTIAQHFEWLRSHRLSEQEKKLAKKYIPNHYCVLMHDNVCLPNDLVGTSSVTSIDIHDIARSAHTYAIEQYFIVTPLKDQQKIVDRLLEFWHTSEGIEYNLSRHEAVSRVVLADSLATVVAQIEQKEGKKPLLIATAARRCPVENVPLITFHDQAKVWESGRPIVFILGTARGLSASLIEKCDYILEPLYGFSDFNHLSVRSAAGIIFDRWLGINPRSDFLKEI